MRSAMVRWPLAAALAAALLLAGGPVLAANLTWDANGSTAPNPSDGSDTWNTSNFNWWTGAANVTWNNGTPDSAIFGAGAAGNYTVNLGEAITANTLTFNAGSTYTIAGGNTLSRTATGVTVNASEARIDSVVGGVRMEKYGSGTLILTGTPEGVGFARTPPVFLKKDDRIEVEIDGIGTLVNTVTREET